MFETKAANEVSWFQPYPETSVEFLQLFDLPLNATLIDVGGGDSRFVDVALEKGYRNIWLLDISGNALERARKRLGDKAAFVHFVESDVVDFKPPVQFDFWHDRAAFHFLTTEDRINAYVKLAEGAIRPGGVLVLGTFSETGPTKCSGLEIKQYSEQGMSNRFEAGFNRIKCKEVIHQTPFNTTQNFLFCSFQRKQ